MSKKYIINSAKITKDSSLFQEPVITLFQQLLLSPEIGYHLLQLHKSRPKEAQPLYPILLYSTCAHLPVARQHETYTKLGMATTYLHDLALSDTTSLHLSLQLCISLLLLQEKQGGMRQNGVTFITVANYQSQRARMRPH